jgi:hypothetical protein
MSTKRCPGQGCWQCSIPASEGINAARAQRRLGLEKANRLRKQESPWPDLERCGNVNRTDVHVKEAKEFPQPQVADYHYHRYPDVEKPGPYARGVQKYEPVGEPERGGALGKGTAGGVCGCVVM